MLYLQNEISLTSIEERVQVDLITVSEESFKLDGLYTDYLSHHAIECQQK